MARDADVHIRCEIRERQQWEKAAAKDRRTLTDWIRLALNDAAAAALADAGKPKRQQ